MLKVAVVGGSGLIGKRHCEHVAKSQRAELVAVVDPSSSAVEVAERYSTTLYATLEDLIASPDKPHAAIVCTPNSSHVPLSSRLAQAGIHVLCEKPISNILQSARQLIQTVESHNVQLLIGHHRRFNPFVLAAKQMIDAGRLGSITAVNGLWTTFKPPEYFEADSAAWRSEKQKGGGVILINFIHEIDLMHYFFGPVTRIHAEKTLSRRTSEDDAVEEGAAITMRFESGVVGTFIISDHVSSPHSFEQGTGENPNLPKSGQDVYRIFGTHGTLSFPDMLLYSYGSSLRTWEQSMMCEKISVENIDVAPFDSQLEHFVDVCNNVALPSCTGVEGFRALVVCEAIRSALDMPGGGGTVDIDLVL